MDGSGELEAMGAGGLTPTLSKPLSKGWWMENRGPERGWLLSSPTRTFHTRYSI